MKPALFAVFSFLVSFAVCPAHAEVSPVWQVSIGKNQSSRFYIPEIDKDGSLYAPKDAGLVKIDKEGQKVWEYAVPVGYSRILTGSPVLAGDSVVLLTGYVGGTNAHFINTETGIAKKITELTNTNNGSAAGYYYSKPSLSQDGGALFINMTYPNKLFSLDTESGEVTQTKFISDYTGGPSYGTQVTGYSGAVYFGTLDGLASAYYPARYLDGFTNDGGDFKLFNQDPSPSLTMSLSLFGPAIDYKNRRLYFYDFYGPGKQGALIYLNLADGTYLGKVDLGVGTESKSSPKIDRFGNVFLLTSGGNSPEKNRLTKITSGGEIAETVTFPVNFSVITDITMDNTGAVYVALDKFYKFNNNLEEEFSYDLENTSVGSSVVLSTDYLFAYVVSRNGVAYKFSTDYQDPGCLRDYYCDSVPKHRPIIFVHGLGGKDTDWLVGNKAKMRDLVLEEYRKDDPEFPDSWAYAYHYGYDSWGKYNYQGSVVQIARGLQEDVAHLSKEYADAGGDGKVDIVGFSLGGQVIREYLAKTVRNPETTSDDTPHHIGKAIIIASPNKGSWAYGQKEKLPWLAAELANSGLNVFLKSISDNGQPINIQCVALSQLVPESSFMNRVATRTAKDIEYSLLYGDISAAIEQRVFGVSLKGKASLGDTLISADSGSNLPGIESVEKYSFDSDVNINVGTNMGPTSFATNIELPTPEDYFRWQHRDLIEQPEIHQKVVDILLN